MKKTIWTFGLISGAINTIWLLAFALLGAECDEMYSQWMGYTVMILSFSLIYFGVRSYRDRQLDGMISFGKAFKMGLFITLISSAIYVLIWEIEYHFFMPDFAEEYGRRYIENMQNAGKSAEEIAEVTKEMKQFAEMYDNLLFNIGITLMEIFPVGVLISLLCAAILKRNKPDHPQIATN